MSEDGPKKGAQIARLDHGQRGKSMSDLRRSSSEAPKRTQLRPGLMQTMRGQSASSLLSTAPVEAQHFDDLFGRVQSDVSDYSTTTSGTNKEKLGSSAFDEMFGGSATVVEVPKVPSSTRLKPSEIQARIQGGIKEVPSQETLTDLILPNSKVSSEPDPDKTEDH